MPLFKPKPQINVEIIHKNGDSTIKKAPIEQNKVIIRKGRRGKGGLAWTPTFNKDSIIETKKRFLLFFSRATQKRVVVLDGAAKCITFKHDDPQLNGLTFADLQNMSDLESIRRSGQVKIKHEMPLVFWLLVGLTALGLFFQVIQMGGLKPV